MEAALPAERENISDCGHPPDSWVGGG